MEALSGLIDQNKSKKYVLTEIGMRAYELLQNDQKKLNNITSDSNLDQLRFPSVRVINKFLMNYLNPKNSIHKLILLVISIIILGGGMILCGISGNFMFQLFFFQEAEFIGTYSLLNLIASVSFLINSIVFYGVVDLYISVFLNKKENSYRLLVSFPLCFFPMVLYLAINWVFNLLGLASDPFLRLLERTVLILFQVLSLWLLANILKIVKKIKIEQGFIIALFSHLVGFSIVIFSTM